MFKSLVSAVKRLVSQPPAAANEDASKKESTKVVPASAVAAAEADPSTSSPTDMSLDDGVGDFLDNVIAGKTDKLRKELAEQKLLSAAEEATQHSQSSNANKNNNNNNGNTNNNNWSGAADGQGSLVRSGQQMGSMMSNNASTLANDSYGTSRPSAYMSSAARSLQSYELIAYLGSGTFAEVTLARHRLTKELYAIKKISKQRVREEGCVERTFTERQLLANLRHPFLVQLYQAFQSRLYLYLVIDFAQGGDLFYFTEKTLWVKEMKRSLRKFKYPYYTNGGHVSRHSISSSLVVPRLSTTLTGSAESDSCLRRGHHHHHHHSSHSGELELSADATTAATTTTDGERVMPRLVRSGRRHVKKSKSLGDLTDSTVDAHPARASAHREARARRGEMEGRRKPSSAESRKGTGPVAAATLFTPPSQVLRSAPLHTGGLDTDDTDVATARRSVDLFSAEAVEALRRQMHAKQRGPLPRPVHGDGDAGNGTDTDVNADLAHSALAGAGASASTLNAVRAGEYYTTDAVDEFADNKELFSDAGDGALASRLRSASPPPSALANLMHTGAAGGEVANRAEEVVPTLEASVTGEDGEESHLSALQSADDPSSSATAVAQRHSSEQQRRRDVERTREAVSRADRDDDEDEDEDDREEVDESDSTAHRSVHGSVSRRSALLEDAVFAGSSSATRLPPTLRKLTSRRSSASVSAANASTSNVCDADHPLATTYTSPHMNRDQRKSSSLHLSDPSSSSASPPGRAMKRAAQSATDLTVSARGGTGLARNEKGSKSSRKSPGAKSKKKTPVPHATLDRTDSDGTLTREVTKTPSGRSRHRSSRTGGSVVVVHDPTADMQLLDGSATQARDDRMLSQTVRSEILLDRSSTLGGGGGGGDSPLPHGTNVTALASGSSGRRAGRHAQPSPSSRSVRSGRRSRSQGGGGGGGGSSGAATPSSVSGSRRLGGTYRSGARSLMDTPSQSVTAPQTPQKVDLNGPFHEVRTEASHVRTPSCAPDNSRLPLRLIAFYAIEVGLVLQFLHSSGFIYRDLKPENILMRRDGHVMLTDFGVAKYRKGAAIGTTSTSTTATTADAADKHGADSSAGHGAGRATSFTGTAPYMSPEMVQGLPHDTRTDWWSFGCLLFEWCNGRKAYEEANQFALFRSIVEEDVKIKDGDFQLTALELHSRVAQLHYRHQEFVLTCLHAQFVSLPQESQSNVVAALADGSFAQFNHTPNGEDADGASLEHRPPSIADTLEHSGGTPGSFVTARVGGGHDNTITPTRSTTTRTATATITMTGAGHSPTTDAHAPANRFDNAPLDGAGPAESRDTAPASPAHPLFEPEGVTSPPSVSINPSMSHMPKELLRSLAGTPTNLSFQFAPDGSISASVGAMNPFAAITGEHLDLDTYEQFMAWTVEQETEALRLLEDLIHRLLNRSVQERLCGVDVLEHPFFTCSYITSQLYYQYYVREHYTRPWDLSADELNAPTADGEAHTTTTTAEEATLTAMPDANELDSDTVHRHPNLMACNAAGEPDLSPKRFLNMQPPVRRPDAWVDLFEEHRVPPVYVPRLRTQDDLRYFPSAVTAMGLSAAAEQQKRIKEAKEQKRELLRHAVEQAALQSGAVMAEDENGIYLSMPSPSSALCTPLSGAAHASHADHLSRSGHRGDSPISPRRDDDDPPLGSPADLLRRVSSSLTSAAMSHSGAALASAASSSSNTTTPAAWLERQEAPEQTEHERNDSACASATSLTDRLATLIANIPSAEESHDQTRHDVDPVENADATTTTTTSTGHARASLHVVEPERALSDGASSTGSHNSQREPSPYLPPAALCMKDAPATRTSPLVLRQSSSVALSAIRTSASTVGEEPAELGHTQPMMAAARMRDALSPSVEDDLADQPLTPPPVSASAPPRTNKTDTSDAVVVPSLAVAPAPSPDVTDSDQSVPPRQVSAASAPSALVLPVPASSLPTGSVSTTVSGHAHASHADEWPTSTTTSSLTVLQSHEDDDDDSRSTTPQALSSDTSRARRGRDDDDEEITANDIMARTAVLPADFVKAALALAAQQQGQPKRSAVTSPSDEVAQLRPTVPGMSSDFTPAVGVAGSQAPHSPTAAAATATASDGSDADRVHRDVDAPVLHVMQPSAVTVACPGLIDVLSDGPVSPTSPANASTARHASTAPSATVPVSASHAEGPLSPFLTTPTSAGTGLAGDAALGVPGMTQRLPTDDPALYLGVDTTGGYYETDALEEGDSSAAEQTADGADSDGLPLSTANTEVSLGESGTTHANAHANSNGTQAKETPLTVEPEPAVVAALPTEGLGEAHRVAAEEAARHEAPLTMAAATEPDSETSTFASTASYTDTSAVKGAATTTMTTATVPPLVAHAFRALRGDGPLFDSNESSQLSVGAPLRAKTPLAELLSEDGTGGSTSVAEEPRMQSHTAVLSPHGSPVSAKASESCVFQAAVASTVPVSHFDTSAVDENEDEDEDDALSAPVDASGYEEDEESGHSVDDEEEEDEDDEGDNDDEAVTVSGDEAEESAYSDEESYSGTESYSCSGSSYSTTSSHKAAGHDENNSEVGTGAHRANSHDATGTSSSSSSSGGEETGFVTDPNLSFSFGRAHANTAASPAAPHPPNMSGLASYPGAATNASLGGASSMRYSNLMGLSGSYNPWTAHRPAPATSSMAASGMEGDLASALMAYSGSGGSGRGGSPGASVNRPAQRTASFFGKDSVTSFSGLGRASARGSGGLPGSPAYSAVHSLGNVSTASAAYDGANVAAGGGGADSPQPWWRTTYQPVPAGQLGGSFGGPSGTSAQSPTAASARAFPDLALSSLYGPVNTLSGVSYDVEDDIHSPVHASRGHRQGGLHANAPPVMGGGRAGARPSSGPREEGVSAFSRRGTQPMIDGGSGGGGGGGGGSGGGIAAAYRRHMGSPQPSPATTTTTTTTANLTEVPTSIFSTTDTRAAPGAPLSNVGDGATDTDSLTSSTGSFMGFTFNGTHGPTGGRAQGAFVPPSARRPTAVASPVTTGNTFTVSGVTRTSPGSGNLSDEQDGGGMNPANNPDHFANFSFFSAPSGLLPRGYDSGHGY